MQQKITPFLWFNGNAEEAVRLYIMTFNDSKVLNVSRMGGTPDGAFISATFQLEGQKFMALNGGPQFTFTPAISFFVDCTTQDELDELWEKLAEGGQEQPCGWLQDRFGVSWQIIPRAMSEMLQDPDPDKARRVMDAMLEMKKIDIRALQQAYNG